MRLQLWIAALPLSSVQVFSLGFFSQTLLLSGFGVRQPTSRFGVQAISSFRIWGFAKLGLNLEQRALIRHQSSFIRTKTEP